MADASDLLDRLDDAGTDEVVDIDIGYSATPGGQINISVGIAGVGQVDFDAESARSFVDDLEALAADADDDLTGFEEASTFIRRLADGIDPEKDDVTVENMTTGDGLHGKYVNEPPTGTSTFRLTLPQADAEDFAAILGGLGLLVQQAAMYQSESTASHASGLLEQYLKENRDAARHLLLDSDTGNYVFLKNISDDVLDVLDVALVEGGGVVDTVDADGKPTGTEIDIEEVGRDA